MGCGQDGVWTGAHDLPFKVSVARDVIYTSKRHHSLGREQCNVKYIVKQANFTSSTFERSVNVRKKIGIERGHHSVSQP